MAEEYTTNLRLLMFPYLAYGHLTPFLEVAKKLSDRGFSIDLCSTPINLSFIKKKIPHKYSSSIHLVEFHLPDLPELPPHYHTTNGLPVHLQSTLYKAIMMAKPQFYQILKDQKPDVLVHDIMQPWAAGVAASLKIPAIRFCIASAAMCCYFGHFYYKPGVEFPFPALYLKDYEKAIERPYEVEVEEEGDRIMLLNSSRAIDAKYMDYLSEIGKAKILPTGAVFQYLEDAGDVVETELIKWLGKHKEHSTVYVSFGSEYFLTKEEMEEVAYGLELSNVNFIWIVKFPRGEEQEVIKLEEALPQGFLERIGERGRIVEGWAPQARILKHQSIGAFVTHCGWNSILESIEFSVPIIALPMNFYSDQPMNARLIVENGVAMEIARDGNGKLHRGNIAEVIKDVIFGEQIGEDLRRKVKSLAENIRSLREKEMDEVVKVITQLCEKNQSN
ncbi:beta-D-glucosyl crocetin beta-1,6-glucosyltransferase-like isoform X1 [Lycium ferocissimum]|uniref:beta-D-glucosyl crocetin beta-1,6-glucosyltransferase-like isoform X1 n=1 Tax=Lycium ferocissimum TaxID=112874 RepID=UPI002814FD8D|nr:beta-D-glucosyl crocetin beta-1,6-glucosyltransferase-like isoform X1 [Lycium ferocissimum]